METRKKCAVIAFNDDAGHFNNVRNSFYETSNTGWEIDWIQKTWVSETAYQDLSNYIDEIKNDYSIALFTFKGMSQWLYPQIFAKAYYNDICVIVPHYSQNPVLADDQPGWFSEERGPVGDQKFQWMVQVGAGSEINLGSYGGSLEFHDTHSWYNINPEGTSYTVGRVAGFFTQLFDAGFSIDEARQILRENCSLYPIRTLKNGYGALSENLNKSINDVPEPLVLTRGGPSEHTLDYTNYTITKSSSESITLLLRKLAPYFEVLVNGQSEVYGKFDDFPYLGFAPQDGFFDESFYNLDNKTSQVSIPIRRPGKNIVEVRNIDEYGRKSLPLFFARDFSNPVFYTKKYFIENNINKKI